MRESAGLRESDGARGEPSAPLRVLFCHQGAELYGSDRMAAQTAGALVKSGMHVVVALPSSGPLVDRLVDQGVVVHFVDIPVLRKQYFSPMGLLRMIVVSSIALIRAVRCIRRESPDCVYVNTLAQPVWLIAAFLCRRPMLCHVREAETELPRVVRAVLVAPLTFADLVICNSETTKRFVTASSVLRLRKVHVVYNGKDWSDYQIAERPRQGSSWCLAVVGRLSPRKGQDVVVRAAGLLKEAGIVVRVQFAGDTFPGYEWFEHQLRADAARLDLEHQVEFLGFVSDVKSVLTEADFAVVPSRMEPFGTVALEGMVAGRPTIVSDVQGLTEIIDHEVTGLTFPPDDAASLADAIRRLTEDPALARSLAVAGREHARTRFSAERYESEMVAAVKQTSGASR
jgi:glycosyltransferase involved in cell wall biosynthesis